MHGFIEDMGVKATKDNVVDILLSVTGDAEDVFKRSRTFCNLPWDEHGFHQVVEKVLMCLRSCKE